MVALALAAGALALCCSLSCSMLAGKTPAAAAAPPSVGAKQTPGAVPTAPGAAPRLRAAACPAFAKRMNAIMTGITDAQLAKAKTMTPQNVVFVGDSITHQLETQDMTKYRQALGAIETYAVPGDTVDDAAWRMCQFFPPAKTFVIMIGTNNASIGEEPASKVIQLLKYVRARSPTAHIFVLAIFWRSDPVMLARVTAANAAIEKFVKGSRDARMHFSGAGTKLRAGDFADGVHPTNAGWVKVLDEITPALRKLAG